MKNLIQFILYIVIRILGKLPFRFLYMMGVCVGQIYWLIGKRDKHITLTNIGIAFPNLNAQARTIMAKKSMVHTVINVFESLWVWEHSIQAVERKVIEYDGLDLLQQYEQSEKGTLLICGHFGSWEVLTSILGTHCKAPVYLGKSSGIELFDKHIKRGREFAGSKLVNTNREGLTIFENHLRQGHLAGLLSDQEPSLKYGKFAPFFETQALTSLLAQNLIQKTNPNTIMAAAIRQPKGRGFKVCFFKPDDALLSSDINVSTPALNKMYERIVMLDPNQYIWNYKRYKTRPDGEPPVY